MHVKKSLVLLTATALVLSGCNDKYANISWWDALRTWVTGVVPEKYLIEGLTPEEYAQLEQQYTVKTQTGSYLSGRFAQSNFDWAMASGFFADVLKINPDNKELQRRAMVLAMGAGHYKESFDYARAASGGDDQNSLPRLFLSLETLKSGNYAQVLTDASRIPDDGISEFIKPLLKAWAAAGEHRLDIASLDKNVVHFYHAVLIADYLNDTDALKLLSKRDYSRLGLSAKSIYQIADIFSRHGLSSQADDLLQALPKGDKAEFLTPAPALKNPVEGMSRALFDMATVLYQDYPDSAQLFAEMSLYLNSNENDSRILLAHMSAQFKHYDDAINMFNAIDTHNDAKMDIKIKRQIAELLDEQGKQDQAISSLRDIVKQTNDVAAQIQIADIYRGKENFQAALQEYNKAFAMLNNSITADYWNLLYSRGICHERLKNWQQADTDLKAALSLRPDQPYVLNYLGYSWIDRGINTETATRMIEKAVKLLPTDGYIVDSLGWAYYKQGKYAQASQALERAIELSPYDATINDHLGDAYWYTGRKNEARFQWQRALTMEPEPDLAAQLKLKVNDGIEERSETPALNNQALQNNNAPLHD